MLQFCFVFTDVSFCKHKGKFHSVNKIVFKKSYGRTLRDFIIKPFFV